MLQANFRQRFKLIWDLKKKKKLNRKWIKKGSKDDHLWENLTKLRRFSQMLHKWKTLLFKAIQELLILLAISLDKAQEQAKDIEWRKRRKQQLYKMMS